MSPRVIGFPTCSHPLIYTSPNPYPDELIYLLIFYFHPLVVVARYRDPQLQVAEITHICLILAQIFANIDV